MRIGLAAAVASALLFAASHAAEAAPLINLKDSAQAPAGMVDLVRKGGGGGKGFSRGGGGKGFSRGGRGFSGKGMSRRSFSGKSFKGSRGYAGRSFKGYRGKSFKGSRVYRGGRYAYGGGKSYKRYGHRGKYYRRYGYPFFWGGIGVAGAYYGGNCGWLYRRAQATGSAYWWGRYQDCLYYY